MSQNELISVIMPVCNSGKYVREAVKSILNQTYSNFEFIIIDDGSTDNSVSIISQFNDNRIRLFKNAHKGIVSQLNFGLSIANGIYVARMDADDLCNEERLEKQVDFLLNNKDVQVTGTNFNYLDYKGMIIMHKNLPEKHEDIEFMMPINASVLHSTMLTYRETLIKVGGYAEKDYIAEDHELLLRMLKEGVRFYNIQKILYSYRQHNRSISVIREKETMKACYQYGVNFIMYKYKPSEFKYFFQMGLLEYYKGDIAKAKEYLIKAKELTSSKVLVWRYLIFTYLGNPIVQFLRNKKLLWKFSFLINKYLKLDFHIVKSRLLG